jgi:hypothetical protein
VSVEGKAPGGSCREKSVPGGVFLGLEDPSHQGNRLGGHSQALPLPVARLQLMNLALVGIEEIASVWNSSAALEMHRTLGPFRWAGSPAMFWGVFHDVDSVSDLVGNSRLAGGD